MNKDVGNPFAEKISVQEETALPSIVDAELLRTLAQSDAVKAAKPRTEQEARRAVLEAIATGKITLEACKTAVGKVPPDDAAMQRAIDTVQSSRHIKQFLSLLIRHDVHTHDDINKNDVDALLQEHPLIFLDTEGPPEVKTLVYSVHKKLGQRAYDGYMKLWNTFIHDLYATRSQAWAAMERLRDEAYALPRGLSEKERSLMAPPALTTLDETSAEAMFRQSIIHSSPVDGERLTLERLEQANLKPYKSLRVDNARYGFSRPFLFQKKYPMVVAYVEVEDKKTGERMTTVRTFYRSNSQAMWRYMTDHAYENNVVQRFGKGHDEKSVHLPAAVQEALAEFTRDTEIPAIKDENLFALGTSRSASDYDVKYMDRSFLRNVRWEPIQPDGIRLEQDGRDHRDPEDVVLENIGQEPHLTDTPLRAWTTEARLYGTVQCETFLSNDETLLYIFCRDQDGRAWIGGVENITADIVSNGVRQSWVNFGGLETPPFEYGEQAGWEGFTVNPRDPQYVDIYPIYVSKFPMIKRYVESVKKRKK